MPSIKQGRVSDILWRGLENGKEIADLKRQTYLEPMDKLIQQGSAPLRAIVELDDETYRDLMDFEKSLPSEGNPEDLEWVQRWKKEYDQSKWTICRDGS